MNKLASLWSSSTLSFSTALCSSALPAYSACQLHWRFAASSMTTYVRLADRSSCQAFFKDYAVNVRKLSMGQWHSISTLIVSLHWIWRCYMLLTASGYRYSSFAPLSIVHQIMHLIFIYSRRKWCDKFLIPSILFLLWFIVSSVLCSDVGTLTPSNHDFASGSLMDKVLKSGQWHGMLTVSLHWRSSNFLFTHGADCAISSWILLYCSSFFSDLFRCASLMANFLKFANLAYLLSCQLWAFCSTSFLHVLRA